MIQITKWLNPEDETYYRGTYITVGEWLMIEKEHIAKLTGKITTIRTNIEGAKAIFRKRIK
jgi:hypothetical protein